MLQANVKSVSVSAVTEVSDKETQYEVMIPNFSLGFGIDQVNLTVQMDTDDSLDQAIVAAMKKSRECFDVGTQTNIGNTREDAIVIDLKKTMDILELLNSISDEMKTIQFLQEKNIFRKERYCCHNFCTLVGDVTKSDKHVWQCKTCRKRYSSVKILFFFKSKLTLQVLVLILYFFSNCSTVSQCCKFSKRNVPKHQ